eukprot:TRINITY_DN9690_c0_g1_i3.p1 TRINITY_DN9690_c0_g1~~TRINITY_DN9690_c0_g1_i3.p1  ORF type:complete len:477 (+),score=80.55 TRINITY_DN9690_c0_g1_i3:82-1431(+)
MSAPVVSGHAALLRQYFMEGWYPDGVKNGSNSFVPSASLLKGLIIHSGVEIAESMSGAGILPSPSVHQGFGRVQLRDILNFEDDSSGTVLFFFEANLRHNDFKLFCFHNRGPSSLKATLVWMDPPPAHSLIGLMNNLDLAVITSSSSGKSKLWVGNQRGEGEWDNLNNVEQVLVSSLESSDVIDVVIHVRATTAAEYDQPFVLVVSGNLSQSDSCQNQFYCPGFCSNRGRCVEGVCKCNDFYFGHSCQFASILLSQTSLNEHSQDPSKWQLFHLLVENTNIINVKFDMTSADGAGYIVAGTNFPPDLSVFSATVNLNKNAFSQSITFNSTTPGTIHYVGLYTLCCDQRLSLRISTTTETPFTQVLAYGLWTAVVAIIIAATVGFTIFVIGLLFWRRFRREQPAFSQIQSEEFEDEEDPDDLPSPDMHSVELGELKDPENDATVMVDTGK